MAWTPAPLTRLGQDLTGGNASKWNQGIGGRKDHRKDRYPTTKIGEGRHVAPACRRGRPHFTWLLTEVEGTA